MSRQKLHQLKPFLSVFLLIITLFAIAFSHLEERRLGYSILKLRSEYRRIHEEIRKKEVEIARLTQPERLDRLAKERFGLQDTKRAQVIYLQME